MRIIKFRYKIKGIKKLLYDSDYNFNYLASSRKFVRGPTREIFEVEDEQQFTGFTDKNGKEIYEGDIVNWQGYEVSKGKQIRPIRRMKINWDFQELNMLKNIIESHSEVEVIGNIYENPELRIEI